MTDRRTRLRAAGVALAAVLAGVLVLSLAITRGQGDAAPGPLVRANPSLGPFRGLGVWVDVYDEEAWADPAAAVADMQANGVRTLFLQTSNADRAGSFVFPVATSAFVDAAHDAGIQVVAWYLPGFRDLATDRRRVADAIAFRTARGDAFDGFGLDIESEAVGDPSRRTERLVRLSSEIRDLAGPTYPLGAIVPSPVRLRDDLAYWPDFPWHDLALTYDAILPMTYFTFRARGPAETAAYVAGCIDEIRAGVGSDAVAIDVIGGLASDAAELETRAFVRILRARGVTGGGWYSWPNTTDAQWAVLARLNAPAASG
ncbi:MAG: hypothetical protein ACXWYE_06200 [Actinomycetota bacterium]